MGGRLGIIQPDQIEADITSWSRTRKHVCVRYGWYQSQGGKLKGTKEYRFGVAFVSVTQHTIPHASTTHIPTPAPGTRPAPHNLLAQPSVLLCTYMYTCSTHTHTGAWHRMPQP